MDIFQSNYKLSEEEKQINHLKKKKRGLEKWLEIFCNGCFPWIRRCPWNLLASASGAAGRSRIEFSTPSWESSSFKNQPHHDLSFNMICSNPLCFGAACCWSSRSRLCNCSLVRCDSQHYRHLCLFKGVCLEKEMDRCEFEGPPESNLPLKTFVLLSFRTELWCLKVPKKQLIEVSYYWLFSYKNEKNWYTLLKGKQHVFVTTDNALENAICNLHLLKFA